MITRSIEYVAEYKDIVPLYLEIGSYEFFTDPYGPVYSGAIGQIYSTTKIHGSTVGIKETHVIRTEPPLDEGEYYPIDLISQDIESIKIRINYEDSRDWDRCNRDGLEVILYPWKESDRRK